MSRIDWTCPVCTQPNTAEAAECINCLCPENVNGIDIERRKQAYAAQVGDSESSESLADGSRISDPPSPIAKQKSFLGLAAIFLVLVPLVIVVVGYTLAFLIPGCVIVGEAGTHGCRVIGMNLNPLFEIIGFWGNIYLVLGIGIFLLIILPAWVVGISWKEFGKK